MSEWSPAPAPGLPLPGDPAGLPNPCSALRLEPPTRWQHPSGPTTTPETHVQALVRAFLLLFLFFITRNVCTSNRTRVSSFIFIFYHPKRVYEQSYMRFLFFFWIIFIIFHQAPRLDPLAPLSTHQNPFRPTKTHFWAPATHLDPATPHTEP